MWGAWVRLLPGWAHAWGMGAECRPESGQMWGNLGESSCVGWASGEAHPYTPEIRVSTLLRVPNHRCCLLFCCTVLGLLACRAQRLGDGREADAGIVRCGNMPVA